MEAGNERPVRGARTSASPPVPAAAGRGGQDFEAQMRRMQRRGDVEPEALDSARENKHAHLIDVLGMYTVQCVLSKKWNVREQGYAELLAAARGNTTHDARTVYRAALEVIQMGVTDKLFQVYTKVLF